MNSPDNELGGTIAEGFTCECQSDLVTQDGKENIEEGNDIKSILGDKALIFLGLVLTTTIVILELIFPHSLTVGFILFILATPIQVLLGKQFYIRFFRAIKHKRTFTTDSLVVISTTVAYLYSTIALFSLSEIHQFFEASTSVLTIFTIGEFIEKTVLKTTNKSFKNLLTLKPKSAIVLIHGKEVTVDSDDIRIGNVVVAKPGERIATDGIVKNGQTSVDESMISGESIPVEKKVGDKVIGGTINKNGYIEFEATNVGSSTVLANIIDIVKKAKISKAPVHRIADRAVQYFIPIVLAIAFGTSIYWLMVAHESFSFAVTVFVTVLVVSCPCALGIATPIVISLAIDKATQHGILIKGGKYVEVVAGIDTIVFDKTGTLTNGKLAVTDIIPTGQYTEAELLQLASSVETKSEHPIAKAIVNEALQQSIKTSEIAEFHSVSGLGVLASLQEKKVFVGSIIGKKDESYQGGLIPVDIKNKITDLQSTGKTVVGIFVQGNLAGLIAVADTLRENVRSVINEIKKLSKNVIVMSGDNTNTANAIAKQLGIKSVMAEVSPEDKAREIKKLQNQGKKVMMIGDGINDAPALTQADIGMAMGSGTDVAISSGHIILMKTDLSHVIYVLKLGKYAMNKIKQNLSISFAYNIITISIAAGLLYGMTNSLILTPALAALGWVISDTAVFGNSLFLKKFDPFRNN